MKSKKSAKSGQEKSSNKMEKSFISADRQNFNFALMFADHIHNFFPLSTHGKSMNILAPRLDIFFLLKVVKLAVIIISGRFNKSSAKLRGNQSAPNTFVCLSLRLTHLSKMDITAPS